MSKTCKRCGETKPLSEFRRATTKRADGSQPYYQPYCIPCDRERDREKRAARAAEFGRGATREGVPCKKCGGTLRYVSNSGCVACHLEASKRWREENPTQGKRIRLRNYYPRTYDISYEEYLDMLAARSGRCDICGEQCAQNAKLSVDHDHTTGAVRGLLCARCNTGLGKFRDDPALLAAAAAYLRMHKYGPEAADSPKGASGEFQNLREILSDHPRQERRLAAFVPAQEGPGDRPH